MSLNLPILVAPLNVIPSAVAENIVPYSLQEMRLGQKWEMYSSLLDPPKYVTAKRRKFIKASKR